MSRSYKKRSMVWISKNWYRSTQHAFRRAMKMVMHKITGEFKFDPDADWEDAQMNYKKMGDWGTCFGYPVEPHPDDSIWHHKYYAKGLRK